MSGDVTPEREALATALAEHMYPDWLDAHDARVKREAAAEALQQVTDRWTRGGWSDVLLPKPTPPAVPVIAYANRVGDWLRDRIEEARDADHA